MKLKFRVSLLLVCTLSFFLFVSQKNAEKELLVREYREALSYYNQATALADVEGSEAKEEELNRRSLELFRSLLVMTPRNVPEYDSLLFHTCFRIGELEHYFENYPAALEYYARSIEIKKRSSLPDSLLLRPYIYSGIIYYNQNEINKASGLFNLADRIQQQYNHPLRESERLYNTLGVIHYETGNYRLAKFYFQKALDILPKSNPYYTALMTNYKINLAHIHFSLEEYDEANRIYHELLRYNINHNEIYLNLGIINLNLGASRKALENFYKVDTTTAKKTRLYNNIGKAFLYLNQLDSAERYFSLALSSKDRGVEDKAGHGLTLKSMGDLFMAMDSPFKAISYYARSIPHFYPSYADTSLKENPQKFSGVFSFVNLYSALVAKAEAFHAIYLKTKEISWAEEELEAYQSAFQLMGYVVRTYNSDEARLFINRYRYEVHNKPIDIAYELYRKTSDHKYLESLYVIDQQNKASVLALNQHLVLQRSKADSALLQKEKEIRTSIIRNLLKASQVNDSTKQAAYHREIIDQEIQLDRIQKEMSHGGPLNIVPPTKELQKNLLDASTALISLHLATDKITITMIAEDAITIQQEVLPENFHFNVRSYIQSLRDPSVSPDHAFGKQLHQLIFGKLQLNGFDRLLIIPDDELNFLPFESLQDKEGKYLFENFAIQYQYSTAVLKKAKGRFKKHETIAFAPFASQGWKAGDRSFEKLPHSFSEVEELRGEKMMGKTATRSAFLDKVGDYKVVHLATHAEAGNEPGSSFIVFAEEGNQENVLYAEEIYDLDLENTSLVILSACETGAGKLVKGEGVMSLSRAFNYAGCPNIITSLWKADDLSTSYLTKKVHHYLNKNYTIDRAVQAARKDFFEDATIHPSYRHPYYWSHLVFVGNYEGKEGGRWGWIGVLLLIIVFLIFIFKGIPQRKKNAEVAQRREI